MIMEWVGPVRPVLGKRFPVAIMQKVPTTRRAGRYFLHDHQAVPFLMGGTFEQTSCPNDLVSGTSAGL
jgi:hypothetical protein